MRSSGHLQTSPFSAAITALSPEQERVNALVDQIGRARATLVAWQVQFPLYPLIRQLQQARRDALQVRDGLSDQPGWTKAEAETLRQV